MYPEVAGVKSNFSPSFLPAAAATDRLMHLRIHFQVERFFVVVLVAVAAFACVAEAAQVRG